MACTASRRLVPVVAFALLLGVAGQAWATLTVEIVQPTGSPHQEYVCVPITFQAIARVDGVEVASELVTWLWDFGDNATSTENPTTHSYSPSGDYYVTVTATYAGQTATSASRTVHIIPQTTGIILYYPYGTVCPRTVLAREVNSQQKRWAVEREGGGYWFPPNYLAIGTWELFLDGILCGQYAQCNTVTVTNWEGGGTWFSGGGYSCPLLYVVRCVGYSTFGGGALSVNGTTKVQRAEPPWELPGVTVMANGTSISGCATASDASGNWTLSSVTNYYRNGSEFGGGYGWPFKVVAQKAGYSPRLVESQTGSGTGWDWLNGLLNFHLAEAGTEVYGRVVGQITNYDPATDSVVEIWPGCIVIADGASEYSLVCQANSPAEVRATMGAYNIGNNSTHDYGRYLDPYNTVTIPNVPPGAGGVTQNFAVATYGIVGGQVTSGNGEPLSGYSVVLQKGTGSDDPAYAGGCRQTDEMGCFAMRLIPGTYRATACSPGGTTYSLADDVTVQANATVWRLLPIE